jgi:hypothetical protein
MREYVILYQAPKTVAERFAQATPEQAAQGMKLWFDWKNKLGDALIRLGKPLGNAKRVTKNSVTPSDSDIIGMSIVKASSMDDALAMVKDHHHLHWAENCEITVLEELPIPELQN